MVRFRFSRSDLVWLVAVPLVIVLGIAGPAYIAARADANTLAVICEVARSSQTELEALKAISRELGIPGDFTVPEVPEQCAG